MRSLIFIALCAVVSSKSAMGDEGSTQGMWADEDRQHVYSFLENDQLTYWAKTKYHVDPNNPYIRSEGTWQSKQPLCWLGNRSGNVMLYANDQKCCMEVRSEGDKLVLTNVWGEPQASFGICENRVLSRIETMPGDTEPTTAEPSGK